MMFIQTVEGLVYIVCRYIQMMQTRYMLLRPEGQGGLKCFDERAGKVINSFSLHKQQINTIDFL